ncbi:MAG: hypothetical protein L0H59_07280 [Tomitella sp.]|nr:hypothetical protein [Tomitella sp.]
MSEFAPGDKVIIDPEFARRSDAGRAYIVDRKLKVNYVIKPADGVGLDVKARPEMLQPAPAHLQNVQQQPRIAEGTVVAIDPAQAVGALAKYVGRPLVVTKVTGVNLTLEPLGGKGFGVRGVAPHYVRTVEVTDAAIDALMGAASAA